MLNTHPLRIVQRVALAIVAAAVLGGCAPAKVSDPVTDLVNAKTDDAEIQFWHAVAEKKLVANDEAFHAMLLFLDQKDESADYAARVAALRGRKLLPTGFDEPADAAVRRGTLAVLVTRGLDIKGGWALHLMPNWERYAVRELEYQGLWPASSPNQTVTGDEFVGLIGRMEDLQQAKLASARPAAKVKE